MKKLPTIIVSSALLIAGAQAANYTWTNAASDGDWNNATNWTGGVPVDEGPATGYGSPGLTTSDDDLIIFAGAMPTTNVPILGGTNATNASTPGLQLNSGGTLMITAGSNNSATADISNRLSGIVTNGATRTVFTIGDGIGGAGEDVTLAMTFNGALMRHRAITNTFVVNSDGTFDISMIGGNPLSFASETGRFANVILNGGTFITDAAIDQIAGASTSQTGNFVDLTAVGSSFTAAFALGSDFENLSDVDAAAVDSNSFFRSTTAQTLTTADNGDGTFTVSVIPEPSSSLLILSGLTLVGLRRRR